ncbi:MAG: hypothetical protein JXR78_01820 [Victivallales bacterium]|nr:hypothetical protein [Victivallales bacterium]
MSELGTIVKGRVISGRLCFNSLERARWTAAIANFSGDVEIIIRRPKKERSHDQNAYYWGVVIQLITEYTGDVPVKLHDLFKKTYLGGRSTTTLTTREFEDYLEQIKAWAAEHNIIIPDPERVDF